jgi:hypothetical protein
MVLLVSFGIAGLLCGGAFLASFLADNPHLIPDVAGWLAGPAPVPALAPAPAAPEPAPSVSLALLPVYCEATSRWRDPVTRRFVRAPR